MYTQKQVSVLSIIFQMVFLLRMVSGLLREWGKFKTQILFGRDLFSFPLITKQLLTDSQHSLHSRNVFIAFQTCRQTGREKGGGEKWEGKFKMGRKGVGKDCVGVGECCPVLSYPEIWN